jgi:DNA-binding response OmpR family regulator
MVSVLLVEDEREVAELTREALADAGFSVTVALDDRTAYQTLEHEARSFAAVVTDINLGTGVTGFDVARCARRLNEHIKVIYISGQGPHSDQFSVDQALTVEKPYDPRTLARQVAAFIDGR